MRNGWEVEHSWTEEAGGFSLTALKNGRNFWAELARLFDFPVQRGKAEGLDQQHTVLEAAQKAEPAVRLMPGEGRRGGGLGEQQKEQRPREGSTWNQLEKEKHVLKKCKKGTSFLPLHPSGPSAGWRDGVLTAVTGQGLRWVTWRDGVLPAVTGQRLL